MATSVRKRSPRTFGEGQPQPVQPTQAPAGAWEQDTALYDAEILSQLEEFAYIYSHKGFDFGGGSFDEGTSTVVGVSYLQQQQHRSPPSTEAYPPTTNSSLPIAYPRPLSKAEVLEASNVEQIPAISQHHTPAYNPALVRGSPSIEDSLKSVQTDEVNLPSVEGKRREADCLDPNTANLTTNRVPIPSLQQSTSNPTDSLGGVGSLPSKKVKRFRRRRERYKFREWTRSDNVPASPSTSTLSKLKVLFHIPSNLSLKSEAEERRSPLSTAGSWIMKTGREIVTRSRSSLSLPSKRSSTGRSEGRKGENEPGIPTPQSPLSSTKTSSRTTTPTNSYPGINPSSHSSPPPPSTAPSSLSSSLTALPHYDRNTHPFPPPSGALKPWQCTICLQQLNDRAAWLGHEESHVQQVWDGEGCGGAIDKDNDNWFFSCGFCSVLLRTWLERTEHISDHFDDGITMASWNPLTSPYPVQRYDFSPVHGLPACWGWGALLGVQRVGGAGGNGTGDPQENRHWCRPCDVNFPDATTAMRHTEIWHSRPIGFTCPPLTAAKTPGLFFDSYDQDNDLCLLCGDLYPPENWPRRTRHLKRAHGFSRCLHRGRFYREEQFVRHVANAHAVGIEWLSGFVERCRKEEKPPALMVGEEVAG